MTGLADAESVDNPVKKIQFRDHKFATNWTSEIPSVSAIEYERQYQAMRDRVYRDIELRDRVYWESGEPSVSVIDHERQHWASLDRLIREREMIIQERRAGFARSSWV